MIVKTGLAAGSVALLLTSSVLAQTPQPLPPAPATSKGAVAAAGSAAPAPGPDGGGGETPATFHAAVSGFDYQRRDVMIPMRDGVKLHTVILVPRTLMNGGAHRAGMLLTRTPYNADELTGHAHSPHLGPILAGYDNAPDVVVEGGYIRVVQDVRGKYGSEGDYVMNRPLHGTPLNPTAVDHATDTYDTLEWLTHNVPESNGRACIIGISYDGFTPLMALVDPHPALKCSVPMNPMVDGWMGDDWFHNGAFREQNMPYIYEQDGSRKNEEKWWSGSHDDYDLYMRAGSAGALGREHGLEQMGFWRKVLAHPGYDGFWRAQAMDKLLGDRPLTTPVLLVHSLWDQEDIYGTMAVYRALKAKDPDGTMVHLAFGPWHHGQEIGPGLSMGAVSFDADTGLWFRRHVLAPYLAHYLRDDAPPLDLAPVTGFQTGVNAWRRLPAWPAAADRSRPTATALYLKPDGGLGFEPSRAGAATADYVSDPAKPVPFRARPISPTGYDTPAQWADWLVDDQREASGRPDVLTFTTPVLDKPVTIAGAPVVHLTASTSGTDSDWVVKLIDVYPDEVAGDPKMGGYQLAIAMDIFRGRYRESLETPHALAPGKPLAYRWSLPNANHVFLPGHRIMVQVQSSWFPLYDRNPQTFTPSIFWAKPQDYRSATQKVTVSGPAESFVELPVTASPAEAQGLR